MAVTLRKKVRPASPMLVTRQRLLNHFKEHSKLRLFEEKSFDTLSVTEESKLIMPRPSPRNDLLQMLKNANYSETLMVEHIGLMQQQRRVFFPRKRSRSSRFDWNMSLPGSSSLRKRSRNINLQFMLAWMGYLQQKSQCNHRVMLLHTLRTSRYLEKRVPLPKSLAWFTEILPNSPDRIFEYYTRITRKSFGHLVHILETRTPHFFRSARGRRQLPICTQLHLALFALGFYGNGANFECARVKFGYGIGTVFNARKRVVDAVTSLTSEYIACPGEAELHELCKEIRERYGYESAFFMVDGTTHNFAFVPSYQKTSWYDRKSRYTIQALVTNDIHLRVNHLVVGLPGSTHDSRVLGSSDYMREANEGVYFTREQHGLGDAAFGVHIPVVPNYKDPLATIPESREYNLCHSSLRVKSEHTIGQVKNRFQDLKEVRLRLAKKRDVLPIVKYITAGYVLHNMLLEFRDEWRAPYNTLDRQENELAQMEDDLSDYSGIDDEISGTPFEFREKVKHQVLRFIGYE